MVQIHPYFLQPPWPKNWECQPSQLTEDMLGTTTSEGFCFCGNFLMVGLIEGPLNMDCFDLFRASEANPTS